MPEVINPGITSSSYPVSHIFQYKDRIAAIIHGSLTEQADRDYSEKILLRFIETLISDSYAVTPRYASHIIEQRIPSNNKFQDILEEIGTRAILS